jgi:putative transposase
MSGKIEYGTRQVKPVLATGKGAAPAGLWHSRGYLPHFESSEVVQHVTVHLADSLPQAALARLKASLDTLPIQERDAEFRKRVDAWIDAGHGCCILRNPSIAQVVQGSLLSFDSERYRLLAWVVMPNHVHVLFQPIEGWSVAKIVASWKKFTARRIHDAIAQENASGKGVRRKDANREIGVPGGDKAPDGNREIGVPGGDKAPVWHREYWDRYIRNESHLRQAIEYIHMNPVRAGLAATPQSWRWSSAHPANR